MVLFAFVIALQIQVGDGIGTAGKEKLDGDATIGDSNQETAAEGSRQQKMASARVEPPMARMMASTSMFHEGSSGVDQLPKEMHEMKLQDNRLVDTRNDKVCND